MESPWSRDRTYVSCIGSQILCWTTREVWLCSLLITLFLGDKTKAHASESQILVWWLSHLNMDLNHLEALLKYRLWAPPLEFLGEGLGWGLRIWISPKTQGEAGADHTLRTTDLGVGAGDAHQWSKEADWVMSKPGIRCTKGAKRYHLMAEVRFTGSKMEWGIWKEDEEALRYHICQNRWVQWWENPKEEAFGTPVGV